MGPINRKVARRAYSRGHAILSVDQPDDDDSGTFSVLDVQNRSAMCAPLWFTATGEGKDSVIGLVYVDSLQHSHSFGEDDLRVLTALANVAAAKIENVRLLEQKEDLSAGQRLSGRGTLEDLVDLTV